ncbi:MAG: DNA polymerase III subunit gamma/tau [Pseudomonadota bacterium]|nr:DNA polymerase III subunit gamma/tau [Pseudomonadota bacterium]
MSKSKKKAPAISSPESDAVAYRVLARKYRPEAFSGLIGQNVMVRTLTNAFQSSRLAHAFILTGVRGVGKTTTARIIARALNCVGPDGSGEPTTEPCGQCEHCVAISEDRHVDVLEMDAASRTGVDDIRELIEGVRYRPTSARQKVYIIDEVHMLSKNAFNALLKTLEEPPEHVKFVFATTEIRKVPVTVLSRCQRFDLARVDTDTLARHFADIAKREGAVIPETALHLISRAADGSVRDGLSLLDQVISQADFGSGGKTDEAQVRDMLGLADRSKTFELLEAVMAGDIACALELFDQLYREGADPVALLEDMLEITHWLTRIKIVPAVADGSHASEIERKRGRDMESRLSMAALSRAWQMLLKGMQEVRTAPSPRQSAEMVIIRLAYAANLPTPEEALRSLEQDGGGAAVGLADATEAGPGGTTAATPTEMSAKIPGSVPGSSERTPPQAALTGTEDAVPPTLPQAAPEAPPEPTPIVKSRPVLATFSDVLALADEKREGFLRKHLSDDVRLVRFETGRIEINPKETAPADLAGRLTSFLNEQTDIRWTVSVSRNGDEATTRDKCDRDVQALRAEALAHHLVQAVMETFPGATIDHVKKRDDSEGADDWSSGDKK